MKYTAAYKVSFSAAGNADVMKSVLPIEILPYSLITSRRRSTGIG
jgi:hypothetical protein